MKMNYFISYAVTFIIALVLLLPVIAHSQELTEIQKKERCQNNKNRIAELEKQLQVLNVDLSQTMTNKEMEDKKAQLVFVRSMKIRGYIVDENKYDKISAQNNFKNRECYGNNYYANKSMESSLHKCFAELEDILIAKIDKAVSLQNKKPELLAKKNETNKQLASHRTNLIALGCDNQIGQLSGACKLEASWTQDTPGVGSTTWEIKSDGTADEKGIGYAKGKANIKGNVLHIDWKTNTGYSGYYEWKLGDDCSNGKGRLVFKTGRTDSLSSTVKKN